MDNDVKNSEDGKENTVFYTKIKAAIICGYFTKHPPYGRKDWEHDDLVFKEGCIV